MRSLLFTFMFCLLNVTLLEAQGTKADTITDVDGNIYKTVNIGGYEWMAENLRTTTYNDGSKIPYVTADSIWTDLEYGAYCWYNNDTDNAEIYGALYNWYAVNTCKLCPEGWHIPTDEEWKYLESYIDTCFIGKSSVRKNPGTKGDSIGQRLKADNRWESGGNGTDDYDFSALPGGERISWNGHFFLRGRNGFWWTATEDGQSDAIFRCIIYALPDLSRNSHDKKFGFSVRCIRDH